MGRLKTIAEYMGRGDVTLREQGFAWLLNDEDKAAVIEALEKQIPKKPIHEKHVIYHEYGDSVEREEQDRKICPMCKNSRIGFYRFNFCDNCGQAINWEVE